MDGRQRTVAKQTMRHMHQIVYIPVHGKRLFDPSWLSPDVYLYFRVPGTPPCRVLRVENPMTHFGHHTLTFNGVYTSVKRNSSPLQAKSSTNKFWQERAIQSKTLVPFLHYESMEKVMIVKIQYIDKSIALTFEGENFGLVPPKC